MSDRPIAVVLVPVKPRRLAKSRLRSAFGDATDDIVLAMAMDVVSSALACADVARVVVITDDPAIRRAAEGLGAIVHPDSVDAGLNGALVATADTLASAGLVLVCQPADCPCLRPEDLSALITLARGNPRPVFVIDATGTGTSSLAFGPGVPFDPRYGPDSAAAHRKAGATGLRGDRWQQLSRDVDTADDLRAALALGVGPLTSTWAARVGLSPLTPM